MVLKEKMYVRCPIIEINHLYDSRDFLIGQIVDIDEMSEQVRVRYRDPFGYRSFYDDVPEEQTFPISMVTHCEFTKGTKVVYRGKVCLVLKSIKTDMDFFAYYLQNIESKDVIKAKEELIEADFNEGWISPKEQLKNYEFQNPSWYLGRTVVNRMNKVLDNSVLGFKELAGCKIFLMPHQLNTIMRCYQEKHCRYMLADEVGMGKTIEAAAVLKLYMINNANKQILIAVPDALVEQWKVELFLKFDIYEGEDRNRNVLSILPFSKINELSSFEAYDFVIMDEAHRLLQDTVNYYRYHELSQKADNLLLLSATPMQKKTGEFLLLLRLLDPYKYDGYDAEQFSDLISRQRKIINQVMGILDDIDDLQDELHDEEEPQTSKQCIALFDDIMSSLEDLGEYIEDEEFEKLCNSINRQDDDFGIQDMFIAISYVCDNYQLERKIIRNRRNILNSEDYDSHTRPVRHLKKELSYQSDTNEYNVYQSLMEVIEADVVDGEIIHRIYQPLLSAFFSSASAFWEEFQSCQYDKVKQNEQLLRYASKWKEEECYLKEHITEYMEDPEGFKHRCLVLLDYIDQELFQDKMVIFTSFSKTFEVYKTIFCHYFDSKELAFFDANMDVDELELNVYRFQNDKECRIMLCDKTGGEGRNFQIADYVVHIDLPWDANAIEQRIGRLDRLERNAERPDVNSVVITSEESLEQQLFDFWNKGLNVFEESLCGLEIVLEDINNQMYAAISSDVRYGLSNAVSNILETTSLLKKEIKREQRFDTIGYLYKPMNRQIVRLIRYYSQNENELFSSTMLNWASLAGFKPNGTNGIVRFSASGFSLKSARNTLLIPPNWASYLQSKKNEFANRVGNLYCKYKKNNNALDGKEIRGTFDRKRAIDNDYLHFFAPGDDIFDCIVDNAIRSSKGQATAFAMKSLFEWKGFIFTFSAEPNMKILLENGISPSEIAYFRNFLTSEMAIVPIAFERYRDISLKDVLLEYERVIKCGYRSVHSLIDHLGKRGKGGSGFLAIPRRYNIPNIEWFRNEFPQDLWENLVDAAYDAARKQALHELSKKSHLRDMQEEVQRIIAAQVASDAYFRRDTENIDLLKNKYDIISSSLKKPQITLESACFVWMVKQ